MYTYVGINRTVLVSAFPCPWNEMPQNETLQNGTGTLQNGTGIPEGSHSCPYDSTCAEWLEGPHRGIISFDNMAFAYLTVFQVISLEGWITILYLVSTHLLVCMVEQSTYEYNHLCTAQAVNRCRVRLYIFIVVCNSECYCMHTYVSCVHVHIHVHAV